MSRGNLQDHLTAYYGGKSLPSQTARRLKKLAHVDTVGAESAVRQVWGGRWSKTWCALAACTAIALTGIAYIIHQRSAAPEATTDTRKPEVIDGVRASTPGDEAVRLKLVAVQCRADWCRRSPVVAPMFMELLEKYGTEPVLFVTLDITNEATRQQACYLTESLGIEWAYGERYESGIITLLDRDHREKLAVLTDRQQMPQLENALALALPK